MAVGAFNVFEAAALAKTPRLVAASSSSIYGLAENFPTDERHHPYANNTLYGAAKMFGEGMLASLNETHGIEHVSLRPSMSMVPDGHPRCLHGSPRALDGARLPRAPPIIFGDGAQSMDFVYVGRRARFVLAATADVPGMVFNIASGTETTLRQLAEMLLEVMDSNLPIEYQAARTVSPVTRRLANTRLARERLGFEARVGLSEGLDRLVAWWRDARAPPQSTARART